MAGVPFDVQRALITMGEPTRFRILQLLESRARTVGEIAAELGALQPQTTKHLQALESAGVIRVHRLGRRRVARLDREAFRALADHFTALATADADDAVLDTYEHAIAVEEDRPASAPVVLHFERTIAAPAAKVWAAWTEPDQAARWWAPRHFTVSRFDFPILAGAEIRVDLREGDGATYESLGRVEEVGRRRLVFSLAPADGTGSPLFHAMYALRISGRDRTVLTLDVEATSVRPEAAPAVAGLEPGWNQLLDALEDHLLSK